MQSATASLCVLVLALRVSMTWGQTGAPGQPGFESTTSGQSGSFGGGPPGPVGPRPTVTCSSLSPLTNGAITYSPNTNPREEGTTATHICDTGYILSHGPVRTCLSSGTWSSVDITCRATCSNLEPPANGAINYTPRTTLRIEGTIALYSCNQGYVPNNDDTRICENTGTQGVWSGTAPQCILISVGVRPSQTTPEAGQNFTLTCSLTGAEDFSPIVNYQWLKDTIQIEDHTPSLTFNPMVLSDVGQYRCRANISLNTLSLVIMRTSIPYNLQFSTLNIQLRFYGIFNCRQYTSTEAALKTNNIRNRLVQGVKDICGCSSFSTTHISSHFLRCFDESPDHVTYRAILTNTLSESTVELASYIEQWTRNTQNLIVQNVQFGINTTCPVVIVDLNGPECPGAINVHSTIPPVTTSEPTTPGNNDVIIGGAVGGVLVVVIVVATIVMVVLLVSACKNHSKKTQKSQSPTIIPLGGITQSPGTSHAHHSTSTNHTHHENEPDTDNHMYEYIEDLPEEDHYDDVDTYKPRPTTDEYNLTSCQAYVSKEEYDITSCPAYVAGEGSRGRNRTKDT